MKYEFIDKNVVFQTFVAIGNNDEEVLFLKNYCCRKLDLVNAIVEFYTHRKMNIRLKFNSLLKV